MKYALILIFSSLMLPFVQGQSPWSQGKGKQYHQVSFTTVPAYSKLFGSEETIQLPRTLSDMTLQYYGEVGLLNNLTLSVAVPFKLLKSGDIVDSSFVNTISEAGTLNSLGDVEVTAKYQFLSLNGLSLAALVNVGFPTSKFQSTTGLRSGFNQLKIQPTLSLGYSTSTFYAYGFGAFGWYEGTFSDRLYFGAEVGFHFTKQIILAAFISSSQALDDLNTPINPSFETGLFANTQEYTALTLKIIGEIIPNRFGAFAAFGGGSGNLVAKSPAITLGLFVR